MDSWLPLRLNLNNVKLVQSSNDLNQLLANVKVVAPSDSSLEVIFYRDAKVDDGRYANNGWMQELPKPITNLSWDNAALMSIQTMAKLNASESDVVEIEYQGRKIKASALVAPGHPDQSITIYLGYGRRKCWSRGHWRWI